MNKAKITLSHLNLKDLEIILRDGKYGFEKEALKILKKKKNLRLIDSSKFNLNENFKF